MKYLLIMHVNPATMAKLTEQERSEIQNGHGAFIKAIQQSGEMISTQALADPSNSAVVRVRDGVPVVTDGSYIEAKARAKAWTCCPPWTPTAAWRNITGSTPSGLICWKWPEILITRKPHTCRLPDGRPAFRSSVILKPEPAACIPGTKVGARTTI